MDPMQTNLIWKIIIEEHMKTIRHPDLEPSHPAVLVAEEIAHRAVSKVALAKALGVARRTLYDLLEGRSGVSAEMAVRLEAVLGPSAEFWLNMQAAHDLWAARAKLKAAKLRPIRRAA